MIAPSQVVAVTEDPQPGQMILSKTAVPVSNSPDNREYDITLSVKGSELTTKVPVDVVLVLDTSGSMNDSIGNDGTPTRLSVMKNAAEAFVDQVLENEQARVAVVKYAGDKEGNSRDWVNRSWVYYSDDEPYDDASIVSGFSNSISNIRSSINALKADGGTNIEAGFYQAKQLISDSGRTGVQKIVVLMTDGEPTYAYEEGTIKIGEWWDPSYETSYGITYGYGSQYDPKYKDNAIAAAKSIKSTYDGAKIFTVGLVAEANMTNNIRAVLNPTDDNGNNVYQDEYFEATNTEGINAAFAKISEQVNAVATDALVIDTVDADFTIVSHPEGTKVEGQNLIWYVETIGASKDDEKSVTFRVRAKNDIYGKAYTNDEAYLYFNTTEANTYYDDDDEDYNNSNTAIDKAKMLKFEDRPAVNVPPIAKDDTYSVKVGSTLDATNGVLSNDLLDIRKREDDDWTVTVKAVKVSGPSHGTLDLNKDGTFTYENTSDAYTDSFEYNIVATLEKEGSETIELSDTAIVTINYAAVEVPEPTTAPTPEPTTAPTPEPTTAPTPTPTPPLSTITPIETTYPLALPETTTNETTVESTTQETPTTVPTIKVEQQEIPKSGERAPLWPIGLALLLMAGGLTYILHRKDEEEKDQ